MNMPSDSSQPEVVSLSHFQAMRQLITVVQKLSLARSLDTITAIVRVAARQLVKADGATFVLRDQEHCFYIDEDAIAPLWKGQRLPMQTCIGGWTMKHQIPVVIENIYGDERIPFAAYQPTFVKSLAMVPIRTLNPIGAIGVYWAQSHLPTPDEIELLQALADTTALAMENVEVYTELEQRVQFRTVELEFANAQLREEIQERQKAQAAIQQLSITDELTGLNNRRGFLLLADQQLKLARRVHTTACMLFVDLDGLKQVNDQFGHEMGDRLIVDAANVLQQAFRESDVVARLGGDEFTVFVPGCSEETDVIYRLQTSVDHFNQTYQRPYTLSMSIGIAICQVDAGTSLEYMMHVADQRMYIQKRMKHTR